MIKNNIPQYILKTAASMLLVMGFVFSASSQDTLNIGNAEITLLDDIPFFINGSMLNDTGSIFNAGNIYIKGDIINNVNDSLFNKFAQGKIQFIGDSIQRVKGKYAVRFHKIVLDKKDTSLQLRVDIIVRDSIFFTKGNIDLYGKDLYLNNADLITNGFIYTETDSSRIVGDSGYVWTEIALNDFIDAQGLGLGILLNNKLGGNIKVERGHTSETTVTDGSIKKYYNLYPDSAISEEIIIHYLDSVDFMGVNANEKDFMLWTSHTNGYYYENKYGEVDTAGNYVTANGEINIKNPTRVTVSDHICDDPPKVSLGPDTLHVCKGDHMVLNAGNTGYDFIWNTNDTTQKITVNTSGKYEVMVTDPLGCFTYDSIVVVIDSLPYPEFTTFTGNNYICRSDSFTFTNTSHIHSSGAPMSYLWEFGDGTTSTDSVVSKKYNAPGSYTVSLTTYSSSGCFQQATKNVTVNPLPIVKFDFGNVCQTDEIYFTNSSSGVITENLWDFGNGDTSSLT
ncbi:MAG: PKD domain-containing protein [Bacteroidales bacterium]